MFWSIANFIEVLTKSFLEHKKQPNKSLKSIFLLTSMLLLCTSGLIINYISNYLSGKLTDSLVAKNLYLSFRFLCIIILIYILFSAIYSIKDYILNKLHLIMRYNLYYSIGAEVLDDSKCEFSDQKITSELDCFAVSFLRLIGYFLESILSFPMFIFVLYKIGGANIIILAVGYSLFGQIVSGYIANYVYKYGYKIRNLESDLRRNLIHESTKKTNEKRFLPDMTILLNETIILYKYQRLLALFRDSFNNLKNYIPYFVLIFPYFNNDITLGDTVRAIGAFKYIMNSIGFFTDNRMNLVQLNMSTQRIMELINLKKL